MQQDQGGVGAAYRPCIAAPGDEKHEACREQAERLWGFDVCRSSGNQLDPGTAELVSDVIRCDTHDAPWNWRESEHGCEGRTPERAEEVSAMSAAYHAAHPSDGSYENPCARCGLRYSTGFPDPCLGFIPGATEACCGHGGTTPREDEPHILFPPDDPAYVMPPHAQNPLGAFGDYIRITFPVGTPPERVKAVGWAVSRALGRDAETSVRLDRPHLASDSEYLDSHRAPDSAAAPSAPTPVPEAR